MTKMIADHGRMRIGATLLAGFAAISIVLCDEASAQDAATGERIFNQCRACHQVGDKAKNAVGPTLNGLFNRKAGTVEGYAYSSANKNSGLVWDEATFRTYIRDPRTAIPGTKMVFPGIKDDRRITDLIAYLHTFDAAEVPKAAP